MKSHLKWTGDMKFEADCLNNIVKMDAKSPLGSSSAQSPKELLLAGLGGCTAMDVVALMKKHKQKMNSFELDVEVETSGSSHPVVFTKCTIIFSATGDIDSKILADSVMLSQTKYCGVSAMLAQAFPIEFIVRLNGAEISKGKTNFNL